MAYYQEKGRGKRKLYIAVVVILIALIAAGAYIWSNKSNEGSVSSNKGSGQQKLPANKVLNGKYITFTYEGDYAIKTLAPSGMTDLEQYILTADTSYSKQLSVDVAVLPGGNLNNNASYNYRKTSPNLYSMQNITVDGYPSVEWRKSDGSEITVQITKGGSIATLAFTTASTADQLQPEVNAVLQSFRWK